MPGNIFREINTPEPTTQLQNRMPPIFFLKPHACLPISFLSIFTKEPLSFCVPKWHENRIILCVVFIST